MEKDSYFGSARMAGATRRATDFPIATYSLIVLNVVLFLGTLQGDRVDLASRYGLIADRLEFVSLFRHIFLHFDLAHLVINMAFLWLFGRKLERAVGAIQFLLFYIGSGFAASLLHVAITFAFLPSLLRTPVVGASGAVSGVLGMYAIKFRSERVSIGPLGVPAVLLLLVWFLVQAVLGIASLFTAALGPVDVRNIGYWLHIGGFVFGMTAAWVTTTHEDRARLAALAKGHDELRKRILIEVAQRFEALVAAHPEDAFGYGELGRVFALLREQPPSVSNYLKAAELYRNDGRRDEALTTLREALRFWPEPTLAHDTVFRLACCFEALGEYEESASRFAWLADATAGAPEAEKALLKLGQIELDRLHHPDRAAQALERLLREHPESRWADLADELLGRARSGQVK